ncbi:MAG: glycosyltransferase family 39 protein [Myxococcaceae bacterium]|nr:glycosyltransferase family 39 protein [Myxococcaceae bacterium]
MSEQRQNKLIGWALFLGGFFALLFTEKSVGFTRDESVYFAAAESHARWFTLLVKEPARAFTDAAIVQAFDYNHEHPALLKNLFGLSYLLFHEGLGWLRPAAAFRLPAFAFAALILPLIFALAKDRLGRPAAIFAAISFLLVPRQFFNAHLSCFDVPVAAMWLLVVYCFWKAQEAPRYWLYTGLAFGAAIATKHNAFFLPFVLIPFSLVWGWFASKEKPAARSSFLQILGGFIAAAAGYGLLVLLWGPEGFQQKFLLMSPQIVLFVAAVVFGGWKLRQLHREDDATFRAVAPLVAMAALGPVIFYLHWPYLWHHPVDRTAWYLAFHATHNHYAWFYLGELLREPPFPLAYVLVKTAMTVPTALFVPMVIGFIAMLIRAARGQATRWDFLVAAHAVASIAIISSPSVPHFGGVKHWFPSMPFLAMFAGAAVMASAQGLEEWTRTKTKALPSNAAFIGISVLLFASPLIATARYGEYGTSHYSELAGGLPGAASAGMQRQFWANNVTGVLEWINKNAQPGERVYLHECHAGQIHDYQRNGMLRTDLRFVGGPFDADIVAYQYHQEFREQEFNTWQALNTTRPATGLYLDETPQVIVYRRSR